MLIQKGNITTRSRPIWVSRSQRTEVLESIHNVVRVDLGASLGIEDPRSDDRNRAPCYVVLECLVRGRAGYVAFERSRHQGDPLCSCSCHPRYPMSHFFAIDQLGEAPEVPRLNRVT
jgi:hypothetical protein